MQGNIVSAYYHDQKMLCFLLQSEESVAETNVYNYSPHFTKDGFQNQAQFNPGFAEKLTPKEEPILTVTIKSEYSASQPVSMHE